MLGIVLPSWLLFLLSNAYSVLGPYPSLYGVHLICMHRLHSTHLLSNKVEAKAFCLINSQSLTDSNLKFHYIVKLFPMITFMIVLRTY